MRLTIGCLVLVILTRSTLVGQQSQFQGSVPAGVPSATPLALTLHEAIVRGLKTNLGLLISESANEIARGERQQALSALLPQFSGRAGETVEQLNLKTVGFNLKIPGISIPTIAGPFHYHRRPRLRIVDGFRLQRAEELHSLSGEQARRSALGAGCT